MSRCPEMTTQTPSCPLAMTPAEGERKGRTSGVTLCFPSKSMGSDPQTGTFWSGAKCQAPAEPLPSPRRHSSQGGCGLSQDRGPQPPPGPPDVQSAWDFSGGAPPNTAGQLEGKQALTMMVSFPRVGCGGGPILWGGGEARRHRARAPGEGGKEQRQPKAQEEGREAGGGEENSSLTAALPYKGMLQGLAGSVENVGM